MSATAVSPRPIWVKPLVVGSVNGTPVLLFDWEFLGRDFTALRFVIIDTGAGDLTVTPECAYEAVGPAEAGAAAPALFQVHPGEAYGDPYGMDEMRPWWRVWINGISTFKWGVMGIPR